jgi:hypothetical protein
MNRGKDKLRVKHHRQRLINFPTGDKADKVRFLLTHASCPCVVCGLVSKSTGRQGDRHGSLMILIIGKQKMQLPIGLKEHPVYGILASHSRFPSRSCGLVL